MKLYKIPVLDSTPFVVTSIIALIALLMLFLFGPGPVIGGYFKEHLRCGRIVGLQEDFATPKHPAEYFITIQGVDSHGATLKETYQVDPNTYRAFENAEYFCPGMAD